METRQTPLPWDRYNANQDLLKLWEKRGSEIKDRPDAPVVFAAHCLKLAELRDRLQNDPVALPKPVPSLTDDICRQLRSGAALNDRLTRDQKDLVRQVASATAEYMLDKAVLDGELTEKNRRSAMLPEQVVEGLAAAVTATVLALDAHARAVLLSSMVEVEGEES